VRSALSESQLQESELKVIRNGVDIARFTPNPQLRAKVRQQYEVDGPVLLMLANLAPHKGQETAIRVVRELKRRGMRVSLWLAGEDRSETQAYLGFLKELVCELGLQEQVTLLGFRKDTEGLLNGADLVLLPSTSEGLPLSLLQAQATGVPVLAAPTAGVPEIITHEETGFLIPAQEYETYADVVVRLLGDKDGYQRVAAAALKECRRNFSWESFDRAILALYDSLLERRQQ